MSEFNSQQQKAIDAPLGSNVLISAGAGSGKTKTLSYKVYSLVKSRQVDPSSLLVLTFTNKAAFEMKDRILALFKEDGDSKIGEKIVSSHIQTFDSFSLYLAKKYCSLLGLPNNISVMDENLMKAKKKKFLDEAMEEIYKEQPERVLRSFQKFCFKNDDPIKKILLSLDEEFSKMLPQKKEDYIRNYDNRFLSKEGFQREMSLFVEREKEEIETDIRAAFYDYYSQSPIDAPESYMKAAFDWKNESNIQHANTKKMIDFLKELLTKEGQDFFAQLMELKEDESWDDVLNGKKNSKKAVGSEEGVILYKEIQKILKKEKEFIQNHDVEDLNQQYDILISFQDDIHLFFEILQRMNDKLDEYKKSVNSFTFQDISFMAISLLDEKNEKYKSAADEIKARFTYVLVDEYQDTNDIQEFFLNAISKHATLFCVGDAKQSIYAFRNSNVKLFLNRLTDYKEHPEHGTLISMNYNYRSDKALLDDINQVFIRYMTKEHGEIPFSDPDQMLDQEPSFGQKRARAKSGQYGLYWLRFHCPEEAHDTELYEIQAILQDIQRKVDTGYEVIDGKTFAPRPCRYSDFAILLRKKKPFEDYELAFQEAGVPLNDELSNTLTQVNAVMTLSSILHLINDNLNLMKGLPSKENRAHLFLSIARSFLYGKNKGYTDQRLDELMSETVQGHDGNLIPSYSQDPIMKDSFDFCKEVRDLPISLIFNKVLSHYHVLDSLYTLGDVQDNINKIESFYQLIVEQEQEGLSLDDFVEVLKSVNKYNIEITSDTITEIPNAVQLMTIHKSKGLEFPVVYLPVTGNTLSSGGNNMDKPIASFSQEFGILLPNYKLNENVKNIFFETFKDQDGSLDGEINEHVRINYVALTRAKETCFIVGPDDIEKAQGKETLYDMIFALPHYPELSEGAIQILHKHQLTESDEYKDFEETKDHYLTFFKKVEQKRSQGKEESDLEDHILKQYQSKMQSDLNALKEKLGLMMISSALKTGLTDTQKITMAGFELYSKDNIRTWDDFQMAVKAGSRDLDSSVSLEEVSKLLFQITSGAILKSAKIDKKGNLTGFEGTEHQLLALCLALDGISASFFSRDTISQDYLKIIDLQFMNKANHVEENIVPPLSLKTDNTSYEFAQVKEKKRASMKNTKEYTEDEELHFQEVTDYGTYLHHLLELVDMKKEPFDLSFIQNKKDQDIIHRVLALPVFQSLSDAEIFHEYSYFDNQLNSEGIIDCLIIHKDHIDLMDYKTSNIDKPEYLTQLSVYKRNVEEIFPGKPVRTYLLSILKAELKETTSE